MTKRVWHKGPPPHVGWWVASTSRDEVIWRWWNGRWWSQAATHRHKSGHAARIAECRTNAAAHRIEWTNYYPADARVPRIAP